jgi:hypothetical protein
MALNGLNSGSKKGGFRGPKGRQTLDFRLSFVAILLLCVMLNLAYLDTAVLIRITMAYTDTSPLFANERQFAAGPPTQAAFN